MVCVLRVYQSGIRATHFILGWERSKLNLNCRPSKSKRNIWKSWRGGGGGGGGGVQYVKSKMQ